MIILAIDGANFSTSVALYEDKKEHAYKQIAEAQGGEVYLLSMIEHLFDHSPLTLHDVTHIAVTLGPGSFTGTRISISAARGLALGLGIPLLPMTSFEWVAYSYQKIHKLNRPLFVALESKRKESFVAWYNAHIFLLKEPTYLSALNFNAYIEFSNPMIIGNAASHFNINQNNWMPTAQDLASIVQDRVENNFCFEACKPFYLRLPEIYGRT